jgi:ParB family chromosome partitioning protein
MSAKQVEIVAESGSEVFIPLNKLKKSPNNARMSTAERNQASVAE